MQQYRSTNAGRAASIKANRRWRNRNPKKAHYNDTIYKKQWREKTHFYVPPEVKEIRRAVKRLEAVLAHASHHQGLRVTGQPSGDASA